MHVPSQHRHFITCTGHSVKLLRKLFDQAAEFKRIMPDRHNADIWPRYASVLNGYVLANMFYEPSTRTRFSFDLAIQHLGGRVVTTEAAKLFSSAAKGEALRDTVSVIGGYHVDVIVLRHDTKGSAKEAADCQACPIINAGDGAGEHPTQALLDWFTIWEKFPGKTDLTITLVGDLLYGRTIHSLIQLACELRGTELGFVQHVQLAAHEELALPEKYLDMMNAAGISYTHVELASTEVRSSDVIYMTRTQLERAGNKEEGVQNLDQVGADYALSPETVRAMSEHALIMHPLPRNAEIPTSIDLLPQAYYLQQAQNGLYVRMALLLWIFDKLDVVSD